MEETKKKKKAEAALNNKSISQNCKSFEDESETEPLIRPDVCRYTQVRGQGNTALVQTGISIAGTQHMQHRDPETAKTILVAAAARSRINDLDRNVCHEAAAGSNMMMMMMATNPSPGASICPETDIFSKLFRPGAFLSPRP